MLRSMILTFVFSLIVSSTAFCQTKNLAGTIESVEPNSNGITISYLDGKATKSMTLDVSRKAVITVGGQISTLIGLAVGDKVTVAYNEELGVATKIEAAGELTEGWTFFPTDKNADPEKSFVVSNEGTLVCLPRAPAFALGSNKVFNEMIFKVEYKFPNQDTTGGAVVIAAKDPDLKSNDWVKRIPFGFETKLAPEKVGELYLPSKTFKCELPFGQIRDGRNVVRVRKTEVKVGAWNTLECTVDANKNFTIKVNDELVNGIGKAESANGKIFLWALSAEVHFRNAVVQIGDNEERLDFNQIRKNDASNKPKGKQK